MFNFDYLSIEDIKENKPNWPKISGHPYRMLIVAGFGSKKCITSSNK